jgi:hypothetical protein
VNGSQTTSETDKWQCMTESWKPQAQYHISTVRQNDRLVWTENTRNYKIRSSLGNQMFHEWTMGHSTKLFFFQCILDYVVQPRKNLINSQNTVKIASVKTIIKLNC